MNKKVIVIIIFLLIFSAGAVWFLKLDDKITDKGGNLYVFTSVKDALSKNLTISCEFNDSNSTFKSYIKNGAVRVTTSGGSDVQAGEMLLLDEKMYVWDSKTEQGFIYNVPKTEVNTSASNGDLVKTESYFEMIDKYKDSCKIASLDDAYFAVPADVKFEDMSKFLEDLQKQTPQIELPN